MENKIKHYCFLVIFLPFYFQFLSSYCFIFQVALGNRTLSCVPGIFTALKELFSSWSIGGFEEPQAKKTPRYPKASQSFPMVLTLPGLSSPPIQVSLWFGWEIAITV